MTLPGGTITPNEFLDGRHDETPPADILRAGALDLDAAWPVDASCDTRRVRRITLDHRGASARLRPTGGQTFLGVLAGRFTVGHESDVVGPGELVQLPDDGCDVILITPNPTGELVLLDIGPATDVEPGPDLPIPVARGGNADGLDIDYFHGYADRYEQVYRHGATTWETEQPNDVLTTTIAEAGIAPCRVIDLGCGEGRDSVYLAGKGFDVLGVDVSHAALERARARAGAADLACRFLERDVTTLRGIPDADFDLALNMGCLHMIPDPAARARHLRRVHDVLRPGGLFLLAHCRENWLRGFWSVIDADAVGTPVPGRAIDRRIRTTEGVKTVPLRLLPYQESAEPQLIEECDRQGFQLVTSTDATAEAFGSTAVLLFRRPW